MTKIETKEWLDWNVGEGKRHSNLEDLLEDLEDIRKTLGPTVGYAGGNIIQEIDLVKKMIKARPKAKEIGEVEDGKK